MKTMYRSYAVCVLLGLLISMPVLAATISVNTKKSNPVMRAQPVRKIVRNAVDARGDWRMFRHDPQHTGRSPFCGPATPSMKWEFDTRGNVSSSPAIGSDGTIYVSSEDGKFCAINPDGTKKWEFVGAHLYGSPAIGSDGTIYMSSGKLYAINPDGSKKWEFAANDSISSSPTISSDGTIYVRSAEMDFGIHGENEYFSRLYAINPDGTKKWESESLGYWSRSTPAICPDGTIYVGTASSYYYEWYGYLLAINSDGSVRWGYKVDDWIESSPAVGSDGTIYFRSGYNYDETYLYALNSDGTKKWSVTVGGTISSPAIGIGANISSPAIGSDGTIYIGSCDGKLYAINPDGTIKWEFATGNRIESSPAIGGDGTIYFGSNDAKLYAVNPDGTKKWEYAKDYPFRSSPAIGRDGTIYIGSDDGKLYATRALSNAAINIVAPSIQYATEGPISYTVVYTDATAVTLSVADITLNKTGTANGTVSVTGSGTSSRTVTISSITGNGTLGISIAAGTATNANGLGAPAAGPSTTFSVLNLASAWSGVAMVSMPIIPDATASATNPNLTDPKIAVGFSDNNWFWFDPVANKYSQYPDIKTWYDPRTDAPYRGFWAKFVGVPAVPAGTIPDQTTPKTIHLLPGWNLIGQPFVSPVSWDVSKIQVKVNGADPKALTGASDIAGDYAWGWDNVNGKYYLVYDPGVVPGAVGVLQPWQAYWFMAKVECDLIIPAP